MIRDTRHALRLLVRNPSVAILSIVALAIGIGLTTTMFSIVYGAMLRGLPFDHGERITYFWLSHPGEARARRPISIHQFSDWHAQQHSFDGLAGYYTGTV